MTETKSKQPKRRRAALMLGTLLSFLCAYAAARNWYLGELRGRLQTLETSILSASPLVLGLREEPTLPLGDLNEASGVAARLDQPQLFGLVKSLGLVAPSVEPDQVVERFWTLHGLGPSTAGIPLTISGMDLLVRIAQGFGAQASAKADPDHVRRRTIRFVARALSGWPDAETQYETCVSRWLDGTSPPECESPASTADAALLATGDLAVLWTTPRQVNVDFILGTLFRQMGVPEFLDNTLGDEARSQARPLVGGYARHIALLSLREPTVQQAQYMVTVVRGPEQLVMMFLALLVLFSGVVRVIVELVPSTRLAPPTSSENDESSDFRWIAPWCLRAIPSVGFIGTVRGLSAALAAADTIVSSPTAVEQASAISAVSATLALAFTTTLIALVLGLAVGLLQRFLLIAEGWAGRSGDQLLVRLRLLGRTKEAALAAAEPEK